MRHDDAGLDDKEGIVEYGMDTFSEENTVLRIYRIDKRGAQVGAVGLVAIAWRPGVRWSGNNVCIFRGINVISDSGMRRPAVER